MQRRTIYWLAGGLTLAACGMVGAIDGFKENLQPYGMWYVHDPDRPQPAVVTPGTPPSNEPTPAPSDAIVLFDGSNLDQWVGDNGAPAWTVADGVATAVPGAGGIRTKQAFGDVQLHLEWSAPNPPNGSGQDRGNSGVLFMNRYEVQILDTFNAETYADGSAGAIYGQWPPLVNAMRPPGEWNTYDIIFNRPHFENGQVVLATYLTVLLNGVVVHNHQAMLGQTAWRQPAQYAPHGEMDTISLQEHGHPVRFRNIWLRELKGYDQVAAPAAP